MHEAGIALAIYRQAREQLPGAGAHLEKVEVAIGELSAVEPDLLAFAWQAVVAESAYPRAQLDIDWRPAQQYCPNCRTTSKRQGRGWLLLCDVCSEALIARGGDELDLLRVTYSTQEAGTIAED